MGLVSSIVFVILISQLAHSSLSQIAFAEKELTGVRYLHPLNELIRELQEYRQGKEGYSRNNSVLNDQLHIKVVSIREAINLIDKKDKELEGFLEKRKEWRDIKESLNILLNNSNYEINALNSLIKELLDVIDNIADEYNLTLDPFLDTYYLIDTFSKRLPQFSEEVSLIHFLGSTKLRDSAFFSKYEELTSLKILMLETNEESIKKNMKKILDVDPPRYFEINDLTSKLIQKTNSSVYLLNELMKKNFNTPVEEFAKEFNSIFKLSYNLQKKIGQVLESLLEERVDLLNRYFYVSLFLNFFILTSLLYLFMGLAKNLSDKEKETRAILESTADGIIVLKNNTIILCNKAAGDLFGCKSELLVGEKITDLITVPIDRKTKKSVGELELLFSESNENEKYEALALRKDGIAISVELMVSKIKTPEYAQSSICLIQDILEEKQEEMRTNIRQTVTQILVESHNADYVIPKALQALGEMMGLDIGILWSVNAEESELHCSQIWTRETLKNEVDVKRFLREISNRRIAFGKGVVGRAMQFKGSDWVNDISTDTNIRSPVIGNKSSRYSAFSFPLLYEDAVIAVFEFFFPSTTRFGSTLISTLNDISTQISVSITRDRFASELKKSTLRLTAQYGAMRTLSETYSLQDLPKKILQAICEPLNWQFGILWMVDYQSNDLYCLGLWHQNNFDAAAFEKINLSLRFRSGEELPGKVWSTGKPIWNDENSLDRNSVRFPIAKAASLNNAFGFPILLHNKVLGVIEFFITGTQELNSSLLNMLEVIGPQIGQFIERKQIEKELHESHEYKTAILEAASDSIITTNRAGTILSFNSKTLELFCCSKSEIENKNINDFVQNLSEKMMNMDKLVPTELKGLKKNGEQFPAEISFTKTNLNNQELLVCIVRDITERKKIEKMKSEFISVVSHELRTPLTSIKGSMNLLQGRFSEGLPEKGKQLLDIANKNCERLILLINDILDIEKSESGKMVFKFQKMNIKELVQEAVVGIEEYAKKFNVKIRTDNKKDIFVLGDYDRLIQVLTNLLSNGIKFSNERSEVIAKVEVRDQFVRVSITDHGKGIPEAFKSKIFQKFVQEESSMTRGVSGTGLGLSICKAIIEHHHGKIDFISERKKGSTFYFELPYLKDEKFEEEKKQTRTEQEVSKDNVSKVQLNKPLILHVEDDTDIASVIKVVLEKEADIVLADTFLKAKEWLAKKNFDAVILDLQLENSFGVELLPILDKYTREYIPVIVFSAFEIDKKYANFIYASLVKSSTTNEELIKTVREATALRKKN